MQWKFLNITSNADAFRFKLKSIKCEVQWVQKSRPYCSYMLHIICYNNCRNANFVMQKFVEYNSKHTGSTIANERDSFKQL